MISQQSNNIPTECAPSALVDIPLQHWNVTMCQACLFQDVIELVSWNYSVVL